MKNNCSTLSNCLLDRAGCQQHLNKKVVLFSDDETQLVVKSTKNPISNIPTLSNARVTIVTEKHPWTFIIL